jgi:hypothetical protein
VVIVSGHLDSWDLATGAHDDGTGVAGHGRDRYAEKAEPQAAPHHPRDRLDERGKRHARLF